MTDTQSFIPVARGRRTSLASSISGLALSINSTAPRSPRNSHRRTVSLALSSGDEGRRSPHVPSHVSLTHTRLASAVEGVDPALSPESIVLTLDGTGTEFGTDDESSTIDSVDRSMHRSRETSPAPEIDCSQLTETLSRASNGVNGLCENGASSLGLLDNLSPPSRPRDPLSPVVGVQNTSRIPAGPHGKTSRMIATLQTELEHTKSHLDRVKQEVRNCRREIGTLTRRSEDLRETRDRMRGEVEALNNVIARKERMMADVLARARTAEASATQNASERKELEARVKKAEADSRGEVEVAAAARAKAESECNALRDLVHSMREAWTREAAALREEVNCSQAQMREERAAASKKYEEALVLVRDRSAESRDVAALIEEVQTKNREALEAYSAEVQTLRADAERSSRETTEARDMAITLSQELARLRRFARQPPREDLDAIIASDQEELS
ncbi:unnamed protein product [Cutaneotrichosporon oleaginosum]